MPKEKKMSGKGHRFLTEPLAGGEILCLSMPKGRKNGGKGHRFLTGVIGGWGDFMAKYA